MALTSQTLGSQNSYTGRPMSDFSPLSTEKEERSSQNSFDEDKTTLKEDLPLTARSLSRPALSKQFVQKRYLCLWVLAVLFAFIVLERLLITYTLSPLYVSSTIGLQPAHQDIADLHEETSAGCPREFEGIETVVKELSRKCMKRLSVNNMSLYAKLGANVPLKPSELHAVLVQKANLPAICTFRVSVSMPMYSRWDHDSTSCWTLTKRCRGCVAGECDLFDGNWVHDSEGPMYTNSTCSHIQPEQNCLKNGRPDRDFLYWKWKPRECDLPRFDAKSFLNSFRGKTIGFVGDSMARNQKQSLVCLLEQVEVPKMINNSTDTWYFEQHQVTVSTVWSPYLLNESHEGIMGFQDGQSVISLDVLDTVWTSAMSAFDIMVLTTGPWYLSGSVYIMQDKVIGCHYCPGLNLTELGFYYAFRQAVRLAVDKVATEFKGVAVMITYSACHFEDGGWGAGGQCRREKPFEKEEGALFPGVHNDLHDIGMSEFTRIANDKSRPRLREDVHLTFLDATRVSLLRADGHPGPYRHINPYQGRNSTEWVLNDCVHWCLPGPVDTWNQLLVKLLQKYI